jgi:hypothetical protein
MNLLNSNLEIIKSEDFLKEKYDSFITLEKLANGFIRIKIPRYLLINSSIKKIKKLNIKSFKEIYFSNESYYYKEV